MRLKSLPPSLHTSSSELNYALAGVLTVSDLLSYERRDSINRQHSAYMFEYHRVHIIHQLIVSNRLCLFTFHTAAIDWSFQILFCAKCIVQRVSCSGEAD